MNLKKGLLGLISLLFLFSCGGNLLKYTITYESNGATSGTVPDAQVKVYDVDLTLATNSGNLEKTGFTFVGWNTEADGSGTDYASGGTYSANVELNLYAKWVELTYTVSYEANGSTSGTVPDAQVKVHDVDLTLATNSGNLVKEGFYFVGWNIQADGSGTNYTKAQTYTLNSNLNLFAKWSNSLLTGAEYTYIADSISFKMVYVEGGLTTPTGVTDSGSATVADAFWVGETEITYEIWYTVRVWAEANGYSFANYGREGHDGTDGAAPSVAKEEPVTYINWRDAMIFSNAVTEWYNAKNGTSLDPVYYSDSGFTMLIKTSTNDEVVDTAAGSEDNPYVKPGANGFRLPSMNEWELASRYKGSDSTNGAIEEPASSGNFWTPGTYASGATAESAIQAVAWYNANSGSSTKAVKTKTANALGLYDMSGNVWEFNFDWHPGNVNSRRVYRGGSGLDPAFGLLVGSKASYYPYTMYFGYGSRLFRTN